MRAQIHLSIFNNPDGLFYCYKYIGYNKEMLVNKLSDDINHIKMH